jgi:hypothetical protein
MADAKISQLPVASTPLAGTELVPVVQGGATEQTTVEAILTGTVPSGTANGVLYLNGSKVVTSGSALTFDGTNLAVGTANPLSSRLYVANPGVANLIIGYNNTSVNYLDADTQIFRNSSATEQMRLDSTGLGIGTNNPVSKLHLSGAATADARITLTQTTAGLTSTLQQGSSGLALSAAGSQSLLLETSEPPSTPPATSAWELLRVLGLLRQEQFNWQLLRL